MVVYIVYGCVYSLLVFLVLFIFRNVALVLCCTVALRERRCIYRDFTGMPCGMDAVVTGYRRVTEQHS